MAYTQAQLDEIQITQEQRGLTRKSAVQFCTRKWKREAAEAAKAKPAAQPVATPKPAANEPDVQRKPKAAKPASDGKRMGPPTPDEAKEIVKLYKGGNGMSIPDLAEKFGTRDRGNRIRRVLVAAGVYEGTCSKYYGGDKQEAK